MLLQQNHLNHGTKGCISCQFSECKRRFDTITALRHHMKHFHTPNMKKYPNVHHSRNMIPQGHIRPSMERKILTFGSDLENSNSMTECATNDSNILNRGSAMVSNKRFSKDAVINLKKPFICSQNGCLKAYQNKHYLIQHERVHKGEKPYLCKNCDRRFYRITDLKKHILLKVCQ